MLIRTRTVVKSVLPFDVIAAIRSSHIYAKASLARDGIGSYGFSRWLRYRMSAGNNRARYRKLNSGLVGGKISLRPNIVFTTTEEARPGHEWFGYRDPESVEELSAFIRNTTDRYHLADIGALYGTFSFVFAALPGRQSLAFEPSQQPFEILQESIDLNPELNIRALKTALGDKTGAIKMRHEWQHLVAVEDSNGVITIPIQTLDDVLTIEQFTPDCLKIDVEGYEFEVLQGAIRLLETAKPIIFLEVDAWHSKNLHNRTVQPMIDFLLSRDYRFYDARDRLITNPCKRLASGINRVICRSNSGHYHRSATSN